MSAEGARAIDFNHLDAYTAGDQDLIREVLRLFKTQVSHLLTVLAGADDPKLWKDTAHGIKGAARGIGAWSVAETAAEVEKSDFSNMTGRFAALARLGAAFDCVQAEIDAELAAPA
ncbi:MAG: Hpt domain-containing protein [Alphaproteobacteria bacterium]|jgi:HPt (histidine-containing phosphotransfer) domain-containing protein